MPFTQEISVIMNVPKFKLIIFSWHITCKDQLIGKQVAIPWPYLKFPDFPRTFPGLQNSLTIPGFAGFPGLWEPC